MTEKRLSDKEFYSQTPYFWYKEYKTLLNENEQLKSEIKDLNDVLARYEEKELKE